MDITPQPFADKVFFGKTEGLIRHKCKAKYYPTKDGGLRLASVQEFSLPVFSEGGYEQREALPPGYLHVLSQLLESRSAGDERKTAQLIERLHDIERRFYDDVFDDDGDRDLPMSQELFERIRNEENIQRAVRRAKTAAFDLIECNHDLDCFGTLTFDPEKIDSTSYADVYEVLKVWLSNRVQRQGLKYILCPEHHKDGEKIHFHCIFNSSALNLVKARHPITGRLLKTRRGGEEKQLFNIDDWKYGFTSCELITGDGATDKVAKYVFKYMGKQLQQKIGGRFFLHGGKFTMPTYAYGESGEDFFEGAEVLRKKSVQVTSGLSFHEWNFI